LVIYDNIIRDYLRYFSNPGDGEGSILGQERRSGAERRGAERRGLMAVIPKLPREIEIYIIAIAKRMERNEAAYTIQRYFKVHNDFTKEIERALSISGYYRLTDRVEVLTTIGKKLKVAAYKHLTRQLGFTVLYFNALLDVFNAFDNSHLFQKTEELRNAVDNLDKVRMEAYAEFYKGKATLRARNDYTAM